MNKEEIRKEIDRLRQEIEMHDRLYEQNRPIISDAEYDRLYMRLLELERQYPEFYDPNSPTQRIVTEVVEELVKVPHPTLMLSLEKTTTEEGIVKFATKVPDQEIVVEEKLDGLTVVLTYENGVLSDAVTRGNGYVGERVLHTVRTIITVPKRIPYRQKLVVRGEVIIPYAEFERINVNGEFSNPRNLASGTVRQLDSSIAAQRGLEMIVYDLITAEGFRKDSEMLEFLNSLGFVVVPYEVFKNDEEGIKNLVNYCKGYEEKRKNLRYAIDGLVLKYNSLAVRQELGQTAKAPRWGIAFKFESLEATTTLRDVVWQVGRTGQITPVAVFDEIEIDGVKITRATLHNYQNIKNKDIRIGDRIVVARANDVIPQVVQSIKSLRDGSEKEVEIPQTCPECGSPVNAEGPILFCSGLNCKPQIVEKIIHFCKRDAMNIEGLGESNIELLVEKGFVSSIADLYRLHEFADELVKLEGFGKKKVSNILKAIENSKKNPLSNLLYGLSIMHIGKANSRNIARYFKSMDRLCRASLEEIASVEGIGMVMAQAVIEFFKNEDNLKTIERLKSYGVNMEEPEEAKGGVLEGLVFVITGTLSVSRDEMQKTIERLGGKVAGSVSKKTDYLLLGKDGEGSTKHRKAVELGIKIISEEEFNKMINNEN